MLFVMGHPTDSCYTGNKKMRGSTICFQLLVRGRLGSRCSAGGEQGLMGSLVSIQNSGGRKFGSVKLTGHSIVFLFESLANSKWRGLAINPIYKQLNLLLKSLHDIFLMSLNYLSHWSHSLTIPFCCG